MFCLRSECLILTRDGRQSRDGDAPNQANVTPVRQPAAATGLTFA